MQVIQQFEFRSRALHDQARGRKFNVLITTYELVLKDADLLRERCEWAYLLVDEAHRLKNNESALYKVSSLAADAWSRWLRSTSWRTKSVPCTRGAVCRRAAVRSGVSPPAL